MRIRTYTDGSATTKDKPGGYAWVLVVDGIKHSQGSGHLEKSTNNDAELTAAIQGLEAALNLICSDNTSFPQENEITLVSDSELILGWANGTYRFKQLDKMPLYEHLSRLVRKLKVKTEWVKGHSGNEYNELCDKLANQARLGLEMENKKEEVKLTGDTLIGTKKDGILCLWYDGKLRILDLDNLIIENYDREKHGKRGSAIEIRKEKSR